MTSPERKSLCDFRSSAIHWFLSRLCLPAKPVHCTPGGSEIEHVRMHMVPIAELRGTDSEKRSTVRGLKEGGFADENKSSSEFLFKAAFFMLVAEPTPSLIALCSRLKPSGGLSYLPNTLARKRRAPPFLAVAAHSADCFSACFTLYAQKAR